MNIVFKVNDNVKEKMIDFYKDKVRSKTPPYAIFQAMDADTIITLYESNKVMFQGVSADVDAALWRDMEYHLNKNVIDINSNDKKKETKEKIKTLKYFNQNTVGSDEVGTGDYFGPIVVTACFVDKKDVSFLQELHVGDSKKIDDNTIMKLAPQLIKKIKYESIILDNKSYNKYYKDNFNMNKIKSILHNKVLYKLINSNKLDIDSIVIDQFVNSKKYYEYISDTPYIVKNITFLTKAENQVPSVACASIISRYIFIKEIEKMSESLNCNIPKGAGSIVDEFAKKLINDKGKDILNDYVKLNFKNTEKIL